MQTMAKVQLKCFSFTEAYACVSVTATAEAWAEATADAHASAVSAAVAGCGCLTDAVAESYADSSLFLKLVANAASTATATVCLDGVHPSATVRLLLSQLSMYCYMRCLLTGAVNRARKAECGSFCSRTQECVDL